MRYDREPDAITVACRVTAHIRSSTRALQALLWMVLVLARVKTLCLPLNSGGAKNSYPFIVLCPALTFFLKMFFVILIIWKQLLGRCYVLSKSWITILTNIQLWPIALNLPLKSVQRIAEQGLWLTLIFKACIQMKLDIQIVIF